MPGAEPGTVSEYRHSSFLSAQLRAWGKLGVRKLMVNRRDPGRISSMHPALLAWGQDELSKCQSGEGES